MKIIAFLLVITFQVEAATSYPKAYDRKGSVFSVGATVVFIQNWEQASTRARGKKGEKAIVVSVDDKNNYIVITFNGRQIKFDTLAARILSEIEK